MLKYCFDLSSDKEERYINAFCEIIQRAGYNAYTFDKFILIDELPNKELEKILLALESLSNTLYHLKDKKEV